MKRLAGILALCACAGCASPQKPARQNTPPARSMDGVALGLPAALDLRASNDVGCGQRVPDLPLAATKALVASFSEAGAIPTTAAKVTWTLGVAITQAGVGAESAGQRAAAGPGVQDERNLPPLAPGPVALRVGRWSRTTVTLEATLVHDGAVAWRGNVTGRADSAPCLKLRSKIDEALEDAVGQLRALVAAQVSR